MERKMKRLVTGYKTQDGAGVKLVRVLGNNTIEDFDPILMLDSFDSTNPDDYIAGFPTHPHRGIETISYIYKGNMVHKDSIGHEDAIGDGEVQWMTAGSGIMHEETLPASERMLGVQLWLNMPAASKMKEPSYHSIKVDDIEEIKFDGGKLRLLAGKYQDKKGYEGKYLPLDYYDIHLNPNALIRINTTEDRSIMLFTLLGEAYIGDVLVKEKTAVSLSSGDHIVIKATDKAAQVLFMSSTPLNESVAWGGPIVMNTREELQKAFDDLKRGTFLKQGIRY